MKLTFSERRKRDESMVNRMQICLFIALALFPIAILAVQAWYNFVE